MNLAEIEAILHEEWAKGNGAAAGAAGRNA